MKTLRLSLLFALTLAFGYVANACQCIVYAPDFIYAANFYLNILSPSSVHIMKVVKLGMVGGYGGQFKVLHKYYGDSQKDTITVWGNTGPTCRLNVGPNLFPTGDTSIIVMQHLYGPDGPDENAEDFFILNCGYFYLSVKGDSVFGGGYGSATYPAAFTRYGYGLQALEDSMCVVFAQFNLNCSPTSIINQGLDRAEEIQIFPNPVNTSFRISGSRIRQVQILNGAGQVFSGIDAYPSGTDIGVADLPPGVYWVLITDIRNVVHRRKLVKF